MAEILIRTQDKQSSGDVYIDRHRLGRGDVVAIVADGHIWSDVEKAASFWRIVRLPGVEPSKLMGLLASDDGYGDPEAEKKNPLLRRRASRIDLAGLTALLADRKKALEVEREPTKAEAYVLSLLHKKA